MSKSYFRKNGIVGTYQLDGWISSGNIEFNEWDNGEGLSFVIYNSSTGEERKFDLTLDELNAIAVIGEAIGYIELENVKNEAEELKRVSERREKEIETIRTKYEADYPF